MTHPQTTINLIRHGETDWNLQRKYQGSSDVPLNARGREQVVALGTSMRGEHWDAIYSSDLSRAMDTARAVADGVGIARDDIQPDPRLRERAYGVAEGLTLAEREARWPEGEWEGLESWEAVATRAMEAITDYANAHPGGRIIVVAHGGTINAILATISDGELGTGKTVIGNTSRTFLTREGDECRIGEINVLDHLAEPEGVLT